MNATEKRVLRPAAGLRFLALALAALFIMPGAALAQGGGDMSHQAPLTQADIDAYTYLLPLLTAPDAAHNSARANQLMISVNMGRKRLVYVGAKVAIAQAMAIGAMSPQELADNEVPLFLQPSPEEVVLVNNNLRSLTLAQEQARRLAAGGPQ